MFCLCFLAKSLRKNRIKIDYLTSGEFVSSDYETTNTILENANIIKYDPYDQNQTNEYYDTVKFNYIHIPENYTNVAGIKFMYMGNAYEKNHYELKFIKHNKTEDYPYPPPNSSENFDDYFWKYEGTGSMSIAFGRTLSKIKNPSFAYYWARGDDENATVSKLLNMTIAEKIINNKPTFFVISTKHSKFPLDADDNDNITNQYDTIKYTEIPKWDAVVKKIYSEINTTILMSAGDYGSIPVDGQETVFAYHPKVLIIGATSFSSSVAWYSQWSESLFACAPGGAIDTPQDGPHKLMPGVRVAQPFNASVGKDSDNGTRSALGTNIAVSVFASASAIVAKLFKDHGYEMDYRDLLYLTALTADIVDPNHMMWLKNSAGVYFNPAYGYGQINPDKMVKLVNSKEKIQKFREMRGSLQEFAYLSHKENQKDEDDRYLEFGDEAGSLFLFNFTGNNSRVETVTINFGIYNFSSSDMLCTITSPSNTTYFIKNFGIGSSFFDHTQNAIPMPQNKFLIMTRRFFGENLNGVWKASIKYKAYFPLNQIWEVRLNVTCSNSSKTFDAYLPEVSLNNSIRQENYTYITPYVYDNNISMTLNTSNVMCMEYVQAQFNAGIFKGAKKECLTNDDVHLSFYLKQPGKKRIFKLQSSDFKMTLNDINRNNVMNYTFRVPCLLENRTEVILGARHLLLNRSVETKPFLVINNYPKYRIYNHNSYECFTDEVVDFKFAFNESELPGLGKTQTLHATIFNITSLSTIFSWTFTNYGNLTINFSKCLHPTIPHGVLSIIQYNSTKNSPNIYFPFRYIKKSLLDSRYKGKCPTHRFEFFMNMSHNQPNEYNYNYNNESIDFLLKDNQARDIYTLIRHDNNLVWVGLMDPIIFLAIIILIFIFVGLMMRPTKASNDSDSSTSLPKQTQ